MGNGRGGGVGTPESHRLERRADGQDVGLRVEEMPA